MVKKTGVTQPKLTSYEVLPIVQGQKLGPYAIVQAGDRRSVLLTEKQAQYWLDQGAIRASQN